MITRESYLNGIAASRNYIYLENQWVADEKIWAALKQAAKAAVKSILLGSHIKNLREIFHDFKQDLASKKYAAVRAKITGKSALALEDINQERLFGMFCLKADWIVPDSTSADREDQDRWKLHEDSIWENQIYVHSKMLIVDDRWIMVGSANAGGISLTGMLRQDRPDTELSAVMQEFSGKKGLTRFSDEFCLHLKEVGEVDTSLLEKLKTLGISPVKKWVVKDDDGVSFTQQEIGFRVQPPALENHKPWFAWEFELWDDSEYDLSPSDATTRRNTMIGDRENGFTAVSEVFLLDRFMDAIRRGVNSETILFVRCTICLNRHPAPQDTWFFLGNTVKLSGKFKLKDLHFLWKSA